MLADVKQAHPAEGCGFLAGQAIAGEGHATHCLPLVNELRSPTAFRTEPRSVLRAFRTLREQNWELVAIYHSHPSSAPIPSRQDLAENSYGPDIPWVIIGPGEEIRAWSLSPTDYTAVELILPFDEKSTDA